MEIRITIKILALLSVFGMLVAMWANDKFKPTFFISWVFTLYMGVLVKEIISMWYQLN